MSPKIGHGGLLSVFLHSPDKDMSPKIGHGGLLSVLLHSPDKEMSPKGFIHSLTGTYGRTI